MPTYKKNKAYRKMKDEIEDLKKQINQSRCAVENITSFELDKKYKINIDILRVELQTCISHINTEATKNKILRQIIFYQKAQLQINDKKRKKITENLQARKQKQICAEQTNIDKILNKFNEETAKINELKVMINSNRSQRVICSNLFKKLQKQIKFYQQLYKNQLLISQAFKINYKKSWNFDKNLYISRAPSIYTQKQGHYIQSVNKSSDYSQENSFNMLYHKNKTNIKQISFQKQAKFHSLRDSKQKDPMRKTYKQQKLRYTKELLDKISYYTNLVQKINIEAQSFHSKELINRVTNISKQNEQMLRKISETDNRICVVEEKTQNLKYNMNKMQYEEVKSDKSIQIATDSALLLGFHLNTAKMSEQDQKMHGVVDMFDQIGQILGMEVQKNSSGIPRLEEIRKIDSKICRLNQYSLSGVRNLRSSENRIGSQTIVSSLLDKMEKFSDCDKILDETLFKEEYYKQLGTRKNIKFKKQILK